MTIQRNNSNLAVRGIVGWIGVLLVLSAFILTTFEIISAKDLPYGVLNALGAVGIIISSHAKRDFQPIALNAVWLLVAAFGILKSVI
ncbi:MAG: hypothetical protein JWN33_179 [Candidatus Saccharibacteria bacterium]|nr:hypothetical protein [Candidatus Saccharibacteria bacterium]